MDNVVKPEGGAKRWEGLARRVLTALILAAVVVCITCVGGLLFTGFTLLLAMQMNLELYRLTNSMDRKWRWMGTLYIALPCVALIWIRQLELPLDAQAGRNILFALMALVVATDVGAYFAGRTIGGPKLAPVISPNKTWAGLMGGMTAAAIVAVLMQSTLPVPVPYLLLIFIGIVTAGVAQGGDLFESWLKRRAGVKDSGNLLPGHGGLLDRIDGFMFTTPLLALVLYLAGFAG